jgi:hypothetical protein
MGISSVTFQCIAKQATYTDNFRPPQDRSGIIHHARSRISPKNNEVFLCGGLRMTADARQSAKFHAIVTQMWAFCHTWAHMLRILSSLQEAQ